MTFFDSKGLCLIFFFLVGGLTTSHGQIIDLGFDSDQPNSNYFNEQFLSDNNIRVVTGKISIKKSMRPITNQGLIHQYVFNPKGEIVEEITTFRIRPGVIDTSESSYSYNRLDQLIRKSTFESSGYTSKAYQYNENGQPISEEVYRGENKALSKYQIDKGATSKVKGATFTYDTLENNEIRKVILNNAGRPYMETVYAYNTIGKITSHSTLYYITNKRTTTTYSYNGEGQITSVNTTSNLPNQGSERQQFSYDELGNISQVLTYKNDKLYSTRKFLYHQETALLNAELIKDESSGTIKIIEFDYEYFGGTPK